MGTSASATEQPANLRIEHFSKTFGPRRVLSDVSFDVALGSVHALLGGNGSGKSTLVKALSGVQPADSGGRLTVGTDSCESHHVTPSWARSSGLRFVHQNPAVFPTMTVGENLFINDSLLAAGGLIGRGRLRREGRALLDRFELDIDPSRPMEDLGLADQTMICIARALRTDSADAHEIATLVLDEPTAALPEDEVDTLLAAVRRIAGLGASIIYISHRLDEVMKIADSITVLRDGEKVATATTDGLGERDVVSMIVGQPLDEVYPPRRQDLAEREVAVELRGVTAGPLRNVSLAVRRGEIVGIAGLLGSGRSELLRTVFGNLRLEGGEILLGGERRRFRSPAEAMAAGVAYVPESRLEDAVFPDLSVTANLTSADLRRYSRFGWLRRGEEKVDAKRLVSDYAVRAPGLEAPMSTLSGGNQQKVVLARWMRRSPAILLLDEPTQGVDVGARAELYQLIRSAVEGGLAVLLVSSDFEELADMSDRVLLLADGAIAGSADGGSLTSHRLTELLLLSQPNAQSEEVHA